VNPRHPRPARQRGFSFIELLATLAILALLATAAVPVVQLNVQREKEREFRRALLELRGAIDRYKKAGERGEIAIASGHSGYPPTLEDLVVGSDSLLVPGTRLYFLRRIPGDPFTTDPALAPSRTWGLRCFASPPEAPRPGDDVFDVYSLSEAVGLNGLPYRDW
jgi:general secretion pathway protein G